MRNRDCERSHDEAGSDEPKKEHEEEDDQIDEGLTWVRPIDDVAAVLRNSVLENSELLVGLLVPPLNVCSSGVPTTRDATKSECISMYTCLLDIICT